jgi:hypothetical protein
MTRIAIIVLRLTRGRHHGSTRVWYGNGLLRGDSVLDDILALPTGMPLTGTAFEAALEALRYGDPPHYLDRRPVWDDAQELKPYPFAAACDWMFDECDEFVVAIIDEDDGIESVHRLEQMWPSLGS